jgi:hypothetical protein
MAAVIGLEPSRIEAVLQESDAGRTLDVANYNSFDQTVIAGPVAAITEVKPQFESAGVRAFIPLKVSAPFHSRYMKDPQAEFAAFLAGFTFNPPAIPVIANATAKPYDAANVQDTLASQIGQRGPLARYDDFPVGQRRDRNRRSRSGNRARETAGADQEEAKRPKLKFVTSRTRYFPTNRTSPLVVSSRISGPPPPSVASRR